MSEQCYRCERPATGYVNVTASAASSITVVVRPCCDDHQPYRGQSQAPAPGTGDEATRAAAERLIDRATQLQVEYGDQNRWANDVMLVVPAVLAGDRAAEGLRKVIARLLETGPDEPLMAELPPSRASYFWFCGRSPRQGHAPDCPWEEMLALAEHEGAEAP